jgi:hypothetical protein
MLMNSGGGLLILPAHSDNSRMEEGLFDIFPRLDSLMRGIHLVDMLAEVYVAQGLILHGGRQLSLLLLLLLWLSI